MIESNKMTLSEQIYKQIRKDIIAQHLICGQKLTLHTLKEQFGVSHTPIRDALTRLSDEGLIEYYSNSSIRVLTFTEQDIKELFQFIGELDALSVEFCQFSFSLSPLLFELEKLLSEADTYIKNNDIDAWQSLSEDFHLIFYKYANNHYLDEAAGKIRAKIALLSNLYHTTENVKKIHEMHCQIYNYMKSNDYSQAIVLMKKHSQDDVVFALQAFRNMNTNN